MGDGVRATELPLMFAQVGVVTDTRTTNATATRDRDM
jgi:hypothetical protein